jgi:hypothetical protein
MRQGEPRRGEVTLTRLMSYAAAALLGIVPARGHGRWHSRARPGWWPLAGHCRWHSRARPGGWHSQGTVGGTRGRGRAGGIRKARSVALAGAAGAAVALARYGSVALAGAAGAGGNSQGTVGGTRGRGPGPVALARHGRWHSQTRPVGPPAKRRRQCITLFGRTACVSPRRSGWQRAGRSGADGQTCG